MSNIRNKDVKPHFLTDLSILDEMPTAIFIYNNMDGSAIYANNRAQKLQDEFAAAKSLSIKNNHMPFLCGDRGNTLQSNVLPLYDTLCNQNVDHFRFAIRKAHGDTWQWYSAEGNLKKEANTSYLVVSVRECQEHHNSNSLLSDYQERLSLATSGANIGIWEVNYKSNTVKWDDTMYKLYGFKEHDATKMSISLDEWNALLHPDDYQHCADILEKSANTGNEHEMEFRILWPDDSIRHIKAYVSTDCDDKGNPIRVLGANWDTTDQKIAEQKLKESEQRWQFALEGSLQGVWDWDVKNNSVFYSKRWKSIIGYQEHEIENIFSEWERLVHPDDIDTARQRTIELINRGYGEYKSEFRMAHKDGHSVWILSRGKIVGYDKNGSPARIIGTHSDITELKNTQLRLDHLAHHDVLTGLPNRLKFNIHLEQSITRALRNKSQLAVLYFDLDGFKEVNDNLGHHIGDELLKLVAERIRDKLRKQDTFSRVGGDEFILIMEDINQASDCEITAKKVITTFEKAFIIDKHVVNVTPSIGIALFPQHGEDSHTIIKHADEAMYYTKKDGGNGFRFYKNASD